jgi:hypothetical protein
MALLTSSVRRKVSPDPGIINIAYSFIININLTQYIGDFTVKEF